MGFGQGSGRDHLSDLTLQQAFAAYEGVRHRLPEVRDPAAAKPAQNLDAIADQFDVFLLDAFGVLNIGETAIDGVPARVAGLQRAGKRVLVVTNAAGYPHASLMAKYARLGYRFETGDVISSRKTILHTLRAEPGLRWGLMATQSLGRDDFEGLDITYLAEDPAAYDAAQGFLLMGSAVWTEGRQALLVASLRENPRPVLVGNPDIVAPREQGFSKEPGYFAHRLADETGVQPRFFGKPFENIYSLVFDHLGPDVDRTRVVMVGDSLHTDILGAQTAGIKSALISGYGFFGASDVTGPIASSGIYPDYVLERP